VPDFTGATFTADSQNSASYSADNLGDERYSGAANERWQSASTAMPHWAQRDEGVAKIATWYRLDPGRQGSDPTAWELRGSNDPTFATYTVLDTKSGQSWAAGQTRTFPIVNTTAYRYHRLHITAGPVAAASFAEWEMGDEPPPGAVWEHAQTSATSSSTTGTIGLVHVVNVPISVTHLLCYVGTFTGNYTVRVRDAAGTIVASTTIATVSGTDVGWRRGAVAGGPVLLAAGTYMVEMYSGARVGQKTGTYAAPVNYGPGGEVTIPQQGTVTYRSSTNTARSTAAGVNGEPTNNFGAHALVGMRFYAPTATAHELTGIGGNTASLGTGGRIQNDSELGTAGGSTVWSGTGAGIDAESGLQGAGGSTATTGTGAAAETIRHLGGTSGTTATTGTGAKIENGSNLSGTSGSTVWNGTGAALDNPAIAVHDLVGVGGATAWLGSGALLQAVRNLVGTSGLTEWVGSGARIRHTVSPRDVVVEQICEVDNRVVAMCETDARAIMVDEAPARTAFITVSEGSTMHLHVKERNYLTLQITTAPALTAWEMSLDGGTTWNTGTPIVDTTDKWRWLLSGPEFTPELGDTTPSITVPRSGIVPLLRAIDTPEVIIEKAPQPITFE
jgi:hypothetical protein